MQDYKTCTVIKNKIYHKHDVNKNFLYYKKDNGINCIILFLKKFS